MLNLIMNDYLLELKTITPSKYGAIEASRASHSKYYSLRTWIYSQTLFLDEHFKLADRIHCILNNVTWPKGCGCGCGKQVSSPREDYCAYHGNRDPKVKEKKRQKFLLKYGVENASQIESVKEAKIQTSIEKYGTTHFMKTEDGKKHHKERMVALHGVENAFQLESAKKKISVKWHAKKDDLLKRRSHTRMKRFYDTLNDGRLGLCKPLFSFEEYKGVDNKYPFECSTCHKIFVSSLTDGIVPHCPHCGPKFQSQGEMEILSFISSLGFAPKHRERSICWPMEIDVFVPSSMIGIEFDGLYWHSEDKLAERGVDPKQYHLQKTKKCKEKGIRLIHVFEDEWTYKNRIVKARLKGIFNCRTFKLNARDCEVRELDTSLKNKFLEKYHLQGKDSASISLGLFYKSRLVAVMTFCARRISLGSFPVEGEWELSRFCPNFNFSIRGGAGKLLSYFEKHFNPVKITTYADLRWSQGGLYEALGFTKTHESSPGYWYVNSHGENKRLHRWNFRKSELPKLLKEFYDESKTERQLMKDAGYRVVYDCGNCVYVKSS